jgi:PIN domain nuclease of toxin-antitoxin system
MRLLFDTHVLIAVIEKRTLALSAPLRRLLAEPDHEFHVSVASLWEIAITHRLGKLPISVRLDLLPELVDDLGATLLTITAPHVLVEVAPEPTTRDPFDRLLLAQCRVEALRLLTLDRALADHPLSATT